MNPTSSSVNTVSSPHERSPDHLNSEVPPAKIFELAILRLSKQRKEDLSAKREKISLKNIQKTKGTLRSLVRCNNDLFKYMSQNREDTYVVELEFEESKYIFCINDKGKTRYMEL